MGFHGGRAMGRSDTDGLQGLDGVALRHGRHRVGGVTLHAVEAGPADGPAVVLLHGFPEFWYGWRRQIGALAAAGFRVVVPDGRGYNASDKPEGTEAYRLPRLAGDVVGLADALGIDRFRLAGHDWGGVVAWATAALHPGRVERLAVLNAPHPDSWGRYALTHPTQALRSFYVGVFQLPRLPEALLSAGRYRALRRSLLESSRPGTFTEAELDRYAAAWSEPGALTAMLNWYRALRHREARALPRVEAETLVLWGTEDRFLETALAAEAAKLCRSARVRYLPATHWVQHEEAEAVNAALVEFFGAG